MISAGLEGWGTVTSGGTSCLGSPHLARGSGSRVTSEARVRCSWSLWTSACCPSPSPSGCALCTGGPCGLSPWWLCPGPRVDREQMCGGEGINTCHRLSGVVTARRACRNRLRKGTSLGPPAPLRRYLSSGLKLACGFPCHGRFQLFRMTSWYIHTQRSPHLPRQLLMDDRSHFLKSHGQMCK